GHWKTLTLVAALRVDGVTAPYVIDGAMDGPAFLAYIEQVLVPTLQKRDIVFMDNLRTHRVAGVLSMRSPGLSAAAARRLRHANARATSGTQAIAPDRYQVESALACAPRSSGDHA